MSSVSTDAEQTAGMQPEGQRRACGCVCVCGQDSGNPNQVQHHV